MSNNVTNFDRPDGTVTLRGTKIGLSSDIGTGFVIDCTRHIEDLITAEQLRKKYQLDEDAWRGLATNEPLQTAIERQRERRIRSGEAAREKAQHLFVSAPGVLSNILNDGNASPRHRIEAARELRQTAAVGSEAATPAADRFVIRINLGADPDDTIVIDQPRKPIEPVRNEEKPDEEHGRI
jgi:hypothetical protein